MSLTLLAPALFNAAVPELARQAVRLPNLEALAAAGRISRMADSTERWLGGQLGFGTSGDPPIAALRLASETPTSQAEPGSGYWLCADPIATTMGVDSVRIDGAVTDLTSPQAEALTQALSEFFVQDELRFVAAGTSRWYVRCNAPQRLATTPLWRAIGGSMLVQFPADADAPAWRARLNEAQMLLHAHPVNGEREARGLAPVASVWWWGGGAWPAFGPAQVDAVIGGPRWVRSACAALKIDWQPACDNPDRIFRASARRTLLILDDEWEQSATTTDPLVRWDSAWFAPLRAALDSREFDRAAIVFPWDNGTLRVELEQTRRSRWPRWLGGGGAAMAPALAESLRAFEP